MSFKFYVNPSDINVRSTPMLAGEKIGLIPQKRTVISFEECEVAGNIWCKITSVDSNNKIIKGYCCKRYNNKFLLTEESEKLGKIQDEVRITQLFGTNPNNLYSSIICGGKQLLGHHGIDTSNYEGANVYAPIDGKITASWTDRTGFGELVILKNENTGYFWFAHLLNRHVAIGDSVLRGEVIATQGNTGRSTGSHLHFAFRKTKIATPNGYCGFEDNLYKFNPSDFKLMEFVLW